MTMQELLDLVKYYGEVKFTRKQLNLLQDILNANTQALVNEYNNKNSKSFKVALEKINNINYDLANVFQEVSPSFNRTKWLRENNKTTKAYYLWS